MTTEEVRAQQVMDRLWPPIRTVVHVQFLQPAFVVDSAGATLMAFGQAGGVSGRPVLITSKRLYSVGGDVAITWEGGYTEVLERRDAWPTAN